MLLILRVVAAKPEWIPATVLIREIRDQGYAGGISQLKVYLATLKPQRTAEPVVRFETPPGKQMQVDFMSIRRGRDRLSAFGATLGYSRATFVHSVTDEEIETVLSCLRRSFEAFGRVPEHVLFDNMKTVVLDRDAYGDGQHRFHAQLLELAKDCGFSIRLCASSISALRCNVGPSANLLAKFTTWISAARCLTTGQKRCTQDLEGAASLGVFRSLRSPQRICTGYRLDLSLHRTRIDREGRSVSFSVHPDTREIRTFH